MADAGFNATLAAFVLDGVQFFPAADPPGMLLYIPAVPVPQRDGQGRPAVSIVHTPSTVMLQVGAQFALTDADLAQLIARLLAVKKIQSPLLQPVPISVARAALLLADGNGAEHTLATSTSSLYPPFNAVFSATLNAEQGARAIAAVNGGTGVLFVEYTIAPAGGSLPAQSLQPTQRRADVATWFPAGTGMAHVQFVG
jgi:hypothetical protein